MPTMWYQVFYLSYHPDCWKRTKLQELIQDSNDQQREKFRPTFHALFQPEKCDKNPSVYKRCCKAFFFSDNTSRHTKYIIQTILPANKPNMRPAIDYSKEQVVICRKAKLKLCSFPTVLQSPRMIFPQGVIFMIFSQEHICNNKLQLNMRCYFLRCRVLYYTKQKM